MTIQAMLSEMLSAQGFGAMARDVQTETEAPRLQRYARVVLKNATPEQRRQIAPRFALLRLV
jgi:hypothetical protein